MKQRALRVGPLLGLMVIWWVTNWPETAFIVVALTAVAVEMWRQRAMKKLRTVLLVKEDSGKWKILSLTLVDGPFGWDELPFDWDEREEYKNRVPEELALNYAQQIKAANPRVKCIVRVAGSESGRCP